MVNAAELKAGMAVRIEGQIYKVLEVECKAGTAKLDGVVKSKLRNVSSGRMWEPHFRLQERVEELEIERRSMEFLFGEEDNCTFMDPNNYEQLEVATGLVGAGAAFLQSGAMVPLEFFEGRVIGVMLPDIAEARISSTLPATHAQQDSAWKEASLENGLSIRVPLFIAPGEMVRVDTRTIRYAGRAKTEHRRIA